MNDMELAAHGRHTSAEEIFSASGKKPSPDVVLRRQETCLSGRGVGAASVSARAHPWPGLRYLEKWAQERLPGLWVPGQPG